MSDETCGYCGDAAPADGDDFCSDCRQLFGAVGISVASMRRTRGDGR